MLRIRQPNAKQITLLEKHQFQSISKNIRSKSLGQDAFRHNKVMSIGRQMSDELCELRRLQGAPWLSSIKVGGVLAFGPTMINDVLNNYNHHATLDQKFNHKQFAVDTAKNQTGNLLGVVGGFASAKAVVIFAPAIAAGAPFVLLALGLGVVIGVAYSVSGSDKSIEKKAKEFFDLN